MSKKPLIDVRKLSVAFGEGESATRVVDQVSFHINPGETVALVGESGSGKTVSALSILRLLPNSATHPTGKILFEGQDLLKSTEAHMRSIRGAKISVIFQEPMTTLNPLHTIEKQVGEILKVHQGLDDATARREVIELLTKVGIRDPENRLDAYPHQLSGGQRQRVMIAIALANKPDVLIADEPTTALDVTIQAQILELLKSLQHEMGMAMLLITHDLGIVRHMAERVYVMRNGVVVETNNVKAIFEKPQHAYTRHLLAAEPKGKPDAVPTGAGITMQTTDLKVWFPIKRGLFQRTVDHIKAVDGVSVAVLAGETVGVVGESGSGKTTLGLALLRLISSEGPITFRGERIDGKTNREMRPLRKDMQIVFQDPYGSLSPRLTVGQIIEEGLLIQHPDMSNEARADRVAQALTEVGIDKNAVERYPHEFSGGQRQRIAIARAMVLEPQFVVLDEPTSALDMSVQAQIVELLRDLQKKRGLAYLFISHDLKVVRAMCNQVLVMRNGVVVEEGSADDIFARPREDYTKALLAAALNLRVEHRAALAT